VQPVGQSAADYAIGFGLDQMDQIVAMYTGPDGPADPNISPLDVDDLAGLPPTLILAGEHDPLRDSGVQYAERLRHAGVPVELFVGAGPPRHPGHHRLLPRRTRMAAGARPVSAGS
jgi:acetyl esterase